MLGRRRRALHASLRRHRRGNFEGHNILNVARPDEAEHAALSRCAADAVRGAHAPHSPPARRQDPGRLERPDASRRSPSAGGCWANPATSRRPRARRTSCSRRMRNPERGAAIRSSKDGRASQRASWTTTPSWRRACWICSRPPPTRAGCERRSLWGRCWRQRLRRPDRGGWFMTVGRHENG